MTQPVVSGTGDMDWITASVPDRIEVHLEGHKVAIIREARTDPEMDWVIDIDEAGTYVVIRVDTP